MSIDRWVDKENVAQKYNGIFAVQSLSCIQLCDPMDYSPSGSSVHGVLQVRLWEWVSISYPRWSSWSRDWTRISCTGRWVLYRWATREAQWNMLCCAKSLQLCPTLCNPIDWSPPGSSVHGIFKARILEQIAISFSRRSSWARDQTNVSWIGRRILYHWGTKEAWNIIICSQISGNKEVFSM